MTDFASWFERQLLRREWSRADFVRRSGLSQSTVQTWAAGSRVPGPKACDTIADVFGLDLDYVLAVAGHRPADNDLNDPTVQLIERIRGAKLSERRLMELESYIDMWQRWDREEQAQ